MVRGKQPGGQGPLSRKVCEPTFAPTTHFQTTTPSVEQAFDRHLDGWMDGRKNGRKNGRTEGRTGGWMSLMIVD